MASTYIDLSTIVTQSTTSGDATAANQVLEIAQLTTIAANTGAVPSGGATAANQVTGNNSLASIDGKTPALVSGRVPVDGSGVTQPISAASLPLPTGAATSALQTSANLTLTTISGQLPTTLGQKTSANSLAVVLASDQGNINVTGNFGVAQGSTTSGQLGELTQGAVTTASPSYTTAQTSPLSLTLAGALRVDGSAVTQPISAASLPLPSGAATSALQTTGNTSLSSIDGKMNSLGQKTMANSMPVSIASDQSAVPASQSGTWNINNISGTISLPTGASTAAKQPALGTAGTASTDVITIQGIASMTALTVNGSAVTQPVSQRTPTAGTVTQAAITVGTSAVRLTVSGSAPSAIRSLLVATIDAASPAKFYIGSSSVTSSGATRGVQLQATQAFIANNDAGDYYIISDTAAQTVEVLEQA